MASAPTPTTSPGSPTSASPTSNTGAVTMNQTDAVQLGTTDRRGLIKLAAAGSAAIAGVPLGRAVTAQTPDDVRFNAVAGLPQPPLPNYATHRVEGSVNLQSGTGMITSRVVAGHPGA